MSKASNTKSSQKTSQNHPNRPTDNKSKPATNINSNIYQYLNNSIKEEKKLKSLFGEEIIKLLTSFYNLQTESKDYFLKITDILDNKYAIFYQGISKHLNKTANKYVTGFNLEEKDNEKNTEEKNLLIQKHSKSFINTLNNVLSLHSKIFESIKQTIDILQNFFEISKLLENGLPVQKFITEDFDKIINSWLFLKLDLENFNISKAMNKRVPENIQEFIFKICQDQNLVLNVGLTKWQQKSCLTFDNSKLNEENEKKRKDKEDNDIKMLKKNGNNFKKINISNINDIHNYFQDNMELTKTKSLLLNNTPNIEDDFLYRFPKLEKLKIQSCPSFDISIMRNLSSNITKLSLSYNNFVDYEFNAIMSNYIIINKNIRNNLKVLSFAGNEITKVDFNSLITKAKDQFRELNVIDFFKNKIYKFSFNPEHFPELKLINLCKNNFDQFYFNNLPKIIVLQSVNPFLLDKDLCEEYYSQLQKLLSDNNTYPFRYLNISYLPKIYCNTYLSNLLISGNLSINLKKLDLSNNALTCETFFKFTQNNKGFMYLKTLNLSNNDLDDSFLEKYLDLGLNDIFCKLEHLYLNDNNIGGEVKINYKDDKPINDKENTENIYKIRLLYEFILKNKNLNKLNITKNPIGEKLIVGYEPEGSANFSEKYIKRDSDNSIIINSFFSFLMKIKTDLFSKEDYKNQRISFTIIFDCQNHYNLDSETYPYSKNPIMFGN